MNTLPTIRRLARQWKVDAGRVAEAATKYGLDLKEHGEDTYVPRAMVPSLREHLGITESFAPQPAPANAPVEEFQPSFRDDEVAAQTQYADVSTHTVALHQDYREKIDGAGLEGVQKKLNLVLRHLAAFGKPPTRIFKTVKRSDNRGWFRTGLGGASGMHYYLWWTYAGSAPVKVLGFDRGTIVVREVRHHDDHHHLPPGKPADYLIPFSVRDLRDHKYLPVPWSEEQIEFVRSPESVRILNGAPGSGKTTALWEAICERAGERVLYLTWSLKLVEDALTYVDKNFKDATTKFVALPYGRFAALLGRENEISLAQVREGRDLFLRNCRSRSPMLGPWRDHPLALYGEARANIVGFAVPNEKSPSESDLPMVRDESYLSARIADLGPEAAQAAYRLVSTFSGEDLQRCFPDLLLAFTATRCVLDLNRPLPADLRHFDRLVIDEIQDLTRLEAFLALALVRRWARQATENRAPFVLLAGDAAQTVHPTNFQWGWFKDLVKEQLVYNPKETKLFTNVRSPRVLAEVVERANVLYKSLDKGSRPQGTVLFAGTNDQIEAQVLHCTAEPGEHLAEILVLLEQRGAYFIYLDDEKPSFFPKEVDALLPCETVKGLEFVTVCVLDPGRAIARIKSDIEDYRRDGQVIPIWKRTAVDRLRVAVSRATENLIFLDATSSPPEQAATREFLKGLPKLLELNDLELEQLPLLVGEDWDIEDWLRECIRAAGDFAARDPVFAWRRARQAFRLAGDFSQLKSTSAVTDVATLHDEVCMACARTALYVFDGLPLDISHKDVFLEGAQAATDMSRPDLARLYQIFAGLDRNLSPPKSAPLFGKLLDALVNAKREPWLDIKLEPAAKRWRTALDLYLGGLPHTTELRRFCSRLPEYYNALRPAPHPREEKQAAKNKVLELVTALLQAQRAVDALDLLTNLPWLDDPPRRLVANCLEMIGQWPGAAREYESEGLWVDALRCFRIAGDLANAVRCADHIPEDVGAQTVFWLSDLTQKLNARPPGMALTEMEGERLTRLVGDLAIGKADPSGLAAKAMGIDQNRGKTHRRKKDNTG